jgi:hypothetical protein
LAPIRCQCKLRPWQGSFSSALRKILMADSGRERPSPTIARASTLVTAGLEDSLLIRIAYST